MISRRTRRHPRPSSLCEVELNFLEQELDEEFGVLLSETCGKEEDLDAGMDVLDGLAEDGRVEPGLWDGVRAGGVWLDVVCGYE